MTSSIRRTFLAAGMLAIAMASAGSGQAEAQDEPKTLAVLRFDNNTGNPRYDNLGRAFSSMMISDLSVLEGVQLIERDRIEELLAELNLQQSAYVDPNSAQDVGMIVGAEYVVVGAFAAVEPEMRIDTRIAHVESAEIVQTAEASGQETELFALQEQLANQLVEGLSLVLSEEEKALLREQQAANRIQDLETFILFSEALCYLDYGEYEEAFDRIQDVQEAAPGSGLVRATFNTLRDRVEEEAKDRLVNEAGRRLGGLLGRNNNNDRDRRDDRRPRSRC